MWPYILEIVYLPSEIKYPSNYFCPLKNCINWYYNTASQPSQQNNTSDTQNHTVKPNNGSYSDKYQPLKQNINKNKSKLHLWVWVLGFARGKPSLITRVQITSLMRGLRARRPSLTHALSSVIANPVQFVASPRCDSFKWLHSIAK